MKKLLTILFITTLVLTLSACSDDSSSTNKKDTTTKEENNTSKNEESSTTDIKDVTVDNYQMIIKDYFGIDITLPEGWSVKSATSLNGKSDVTMEFTISETEDWLVFSETIFNQSNTVSTNGIKDIFDDIDFTTFEETRNSTGFPTWKYFYGSSNSSVQVMISEVDNTTISLSIDGLIK
jgi:ABC-type Fe3+-hydroxamate transport system substrate-binding protein